MSRAIEAWRFVGLVMLWLGAWYHQEWLIIAGIGVVVAAWMNGLWRKGSLQDS
jgi:hypothetical protein